LDPDGGPPLSIPLRHFVAALAFLLAGSALGVALAAGFVTPVFGGALSRSAAVSAHVTLAVVHPWESRRHRVLILFTVTVYRRFADPFRRTSGNDFQ